MGIRDRPASAIPVSPFPVSSLPLPLRSLLGPELVLIRVVELVVEVVVVIFVEILIVEFIFIQIIVEVFVELLVLFEFSELLVDVVAPPLERPVRRRLAGLHCPPPAEVTVERPNSGPPPAPWPTPPTTPASHCGPACGVPSRRVDAYAAATRTVSLRSARRPRCTPAPAPRSPGVAVPR